MIFALFPYPRRLKALRRAAAASTAWTGLRWLVRHTSVPLLPRRLRELERVQPPVTAHNFLRASRARRRAGRAAREGRRWSRAACSALLPGRERSDAARALGGRLRGGRSARAGLLRRAQLHAGREEEVAGDRPRADRAAFEREPRWTRSSSTRRAAGRPQGIRRVFADDPHAARAAFAAKVRDMNEYLATLEPRAQREPAAGERASRRLPPGSTRSASRAAAHSSRGHPRAALRRFPRATSAAAAPASTTWCSPSSADQIGARKVDNVLTVRRTRRQRQPRLHAADPGDPARARP